MVAGESPAVARRRLRLALRKARETTGLTQAHVAEALEWSLSKVNRIESGEVTVSSTDLRALLLILGVGDPSVVERLVEDARASRRRGWWDEPKYREHLTPATLQLLQFEGEATAIRSFQPALIPGILQTRDYAAAIFDYWSEEVAEVDRAARLDVRMHRSAQLFDRPDPPRCYIVLDESVLLREVGGRRVMADQLAHLITLDDRPDITIRIVPLPESAMALLGSFTVLDLGDEENAVLYREAHFGDDIVHNSGTVQRYRDKFEVLWDQALAPDASSRLVQARAAEMVAALDRDRPRR